MVELASARFTMIAAFLVMLFAVIAAVLGTELRCAAAADDTVELSLRDGAVGAQLPRKVHVNFTGNAGEAVIELHAGLSQRLDRIVYVGQLGKMRDREARLIDYVTPRFALEELTEQSQDRVPVSGVYLEGLRITATLRRDGAS